MRDQHRVCTKVCLHQTCSQACFNPACPEICLRGIESALKVCHVIGFHPSQKKLVEAQEKQAEENRRRLAEQVRGMSAACFADGSPLTLSFTESFFLLLSLTLWSLLDQLSDSDVLRVVTT
jgi:hypothetical protein